jgi:hypothetical protein
MENIAMTKIEKVMNALLSGEELTAKQIAARYNVANPTALISDLRLDHGFSVYLNRRVDTSGRETSKYRLGTPRRATIALANRFATFGL